MSPLAVLEASILSSECESTVGGVRQASFVRSSPQRWVRALDLCHRVLFVDHLARQGNIVFHPPGLRQYVKMPVALRIPRASFLEASLTIGLTVVQIGQVAGFPPEDLPAGLDNIFSIFILVLLMRISHAFIPDISRLRIDTHSFGLCVYL